MRPPDSKIFLIVITVIFLPQLFQIFATQSSMENQIEPKPYATNLIAHAGGVIDDYSGTNSLEALKESARLGYNIIEVDIMTTSDGKFVLNHDWNYLYNRVPFAGDSAVNYETFKGLKIFNRFTPVTLESLIDFLKETPQISIVTDTKDRDYSALEYISKQYSDYKNRFIPQVYLVNDYSYVKNLGYENIIITLYSMPYEIKARAEIVAAEAKQLGAYALTMPDELIQTPDFIKNLNVSGLKYYIHTINTKERAQELLDMGAFGVYTDILIPNDAGGFDYNLIGKQKADIKTNSLNKAIESLNDDEKALLDKCLVYKLYSEIILNKGIAELISQDTMASCFKNSKTQKAYLPLRKTGEFLESTKFQYLAEENGYSFEYNGYKYKLIPKMPEYEKIKNETVQKITLNENTVTFSNMMFTSEELFSNEFKCQIIKYYDYIVVTTDETVTTDSISSVLNKLTL